ncbi:MAG: hypothetical protein JNJ50_28275, partial [Acidobacteria bacterium]|nr:hypothetical protein [Acidobacteriota bacterium]
RGALAPRRLWPTLDAGRFDTVELNTKTGTVRVGLASAIPETPQARLRVEQPAKVASAGSYQATPSLKQEREAFVIPPKQKATEYR